MRSVNQIATYITGRNVAAISRDTGASMQTIKKVQSGSNRVMHSILQAVDDWINADIKSRLDINEPLESNELIMDQQLEKIMADIAELKEKVS